MCSFAMIMIIRVETAGALTKTKVETRKLGQLCLCVLYQRISFSLTPSDLNYLPKKCLGSFLLAEQKGVLQRMRRLR